MEQLKLTRIINGEDNLFTMLTELYTSTFPANERRDIESLREMLGNKQMTFCAVDDEGEVAGLFIWWQFNHFRFIEHFAIFPGKRNRSIGSRVMETFIDIPGGPVYLEVEPPVDFITKKRVSFYNRHGLQAIEVPYFQPPYQAGQEPVSMVLMSNNPSANIREVINIIYKNVYSYNV